jgi:hypothetical protein
VRIMNTQCGSGKCEQGGGRREEARGKAEAGGQVQFDEKYRERLPLSWISIRLNPLLIN